MIQNRHRRGTVMVAVLACLAVVSLLLGLVVRDALAARRETKLRLQLSQTSRLLDAGILRATRQKEANPEYEGETWTPSIGATEKKMPASVEIVVKDDQIQVIAKLGHEPHITTQSHQYSFGK